MAVFHRLIMSTSLLFCSLNWKTSIFFSVYWRSTAEWFFFLGIFLSVSTH